METRNTQNLMIIRTVLRDKRFQRPATTTLEVLFAVGIVMVGLVGIASLIPYANRQAAESFVTTKAAAATQNLFHEIQARRLSQPSASNPWMIAEDQSFSAPGMTPFNQRYISFSNLRSLITHQRNIVFDATGTMPTEQDTLKRVAFCYDPMFWANQPTTMVGGVLATRLVDTEGPYRRTRFPYYMNNYNPLSRLDTPSLWDIQPRLIRLSSPVLPSQSRFLTDFPATTDNTTLPVRSAAARRLMSMNDELVGVLSAKDKSLPGARLFKFSSTDPMANQLDSPLSSADLLQASTTGDFSWMITYVPVQSFNTETQAYRMSIVFFNKRDQLFEATNLGATSAVEFPSAERVAWAVPTDLATHAVMSSNATSPLSTECSYDGDRGITVDLYGAIALDSYGKNIVGYKIRVGDWIMLSRQFDGTNVHRWYRVSGVSAGPTVIPAGSLSVPVFGNNDPYGNAISVPVTAATVRLVGFDWIFSKRQNVAGDEEPTTATIVPNVAGVFERMIEIPLE